MSLLKHFKGTGCRTIFKDLFLWACETRSDLRNVFKLMANLIYKCYKLVDAPEKVLKSIEWNCNKTHYLSFWGFTFLALYTLNLKTYSSC
jgi:hypothetical protein